MAPPTLASIAAPAPVAAPAPAPAPRKENAKEKAAIDRGLAEVRVERVRVDGLVRSSFNLTSWELAHMCESLLEVTTPKKVALAPIWGRVWPDDTVETNLLARNQALMKIIKHSLSSHSVIPAPAGTSNATATFSPAVGQLLGIDSDGTLEISNAFALPSGALGSSSTSGEGDITESKGVKAGSYFFLFFFPCLHQPWN